MEQGPPEAPPPPAPMVLSVDEAAIGKENERFRLAGQMICTKPPNTVLTFSSDALRGVVLVQKNHEQREEFPYELSALELAVKRRAQKDVGDVDRDRVRVLIARLDDIRLEGIDTQRQIVADCRAMEEELERTGGPSLIKQLDFPSFDVTALHTMLNTEAEIERLLLLGRAEGTLGDQLDSLMKQLTDHYPTLMASIRRNNVERYQLRIDCDALDAERDRLCFSLLKSMFSLGQTRFDQLQTVQSKFGMAFHQQKVSKVLKSFLKYFKTLFSSIRSAPADLQELKAMESSAKRMIDEIYANPKSLSFSSKSLRNSSANVSVMSLDDVERLSLAEANVAMLNAAASLNIETLKLLLERKDVLLSFQDLSGSTAFHICASVEGYHILLNHGKFKPEFLAISNNSGDVALMSFCRRFLSMRKDWISFVNLFVKLVQLSPRPHQSSAFAHLAMKLMANGGKSERGKQSDFSTLSSSPMFTFERYFQNEALSDVCFVLDSGKCILAHRIVLCSQSQVLRAMLEDPNKFSEGSSSRVSLRDVDESSLLFCLQYLYQIPLIIPVEQEALAINALQLADQWMLFDLSRILITKLISLVSVENCFMIINGTGAISATSERAQLRKRAAQCVLKNYGILSEHDDEQEYLREAVELLNE